MPLQIYSQTGRNSTSGFVQLVLDLWMTASIACCLSPAWESEASNDGCAVLDDASLRHFDVRLPDLQVPEHDTTTYVCQVVKIPVPVDRDYHAVAFQPLIDNHDVMHHMILFTCDGNDIPQEMQQPHQCGRGDNLCRSWMAQWSMGVEGPSCPHGAAGVRFGQSRSTFLMLQVHWNNQQRKGNLTDHTGMRVFYTDDLRPYDLGHVQVGQQEVVIPAGATRHAESGGCTGDCTRMLLPHPIHLTTAHLHMHFLGSGGWLEVVHSDGNITQVLRDDSYHFKRPPVHHFNTPVTVRPGDYLRLTCLFSSTGGAQQRNRTVYFGEGSEGEMCYAFIAYYPLVRGFDQCIQLGQNDINCPSDSNSKFQECTGKFLSLMESQFLPDTMAACTKTDEDLCYEGCKQALDFLNSHYCLKGRLGSYMERQVLSTLQGWKELVEIQTKFTKVCGVSLVM